MSNFSLRNPRKCLSLSHRRRSRSSLSGRGPTLLREPLLLRSKVCNPPQLPPCGLTQLAAPILSGKASLSISRPDKVGKTAGRVVQWVD
jgi:hypothetical protein